MQTRMDMRYIRVAFRELHSGKNIQMIVLKIHAEFITFIYFVRNIK